MAGEQDSDALSETCLQLLIERNYCRVYLFVGCRFPGVYSSSITHLMPQLYIFSQICILWCLPK